LIFVHSFIHSYCITWRKQRNAANRMSLVSQACRPPTRSLQKTTDV